MRLTKFQKQLCNILQEGLPICWQPFAEIAKVVGSNETAVLQQTSQLKDLGLIRRICARINYHALGMTGTLVAAHVRQENLQEVAEAVNSLESVSHNYRRNHYYNLWFTLQEETPTDIKVALTELSARFGVDFHSLPVKHVFKLDVRFNAEDDRGQKSEVRGQRTEDGEQPVRPGYGPATAEAFAETSEALRPDERSLGEDGMTENSLSGVAPVLRSSSATEGGLAKTEGRRTENGLLSSVQKRILSKLQDDLELTAEPFDLLCSEGLQREDVLRIIKELIDKGVIRRIAAVVDHRKLGFVANVLFAGQVPQDRIIEAGQRLARFGMVSHCYERETFENWPYNLFAMMHAQSMGQIQHVINKFVEAEKIDSFQLLPTAAELKKQPVRYKLY